MDTVTRGRLRVYLGAAPGVGKTYAMLGEGQRRAQRGTDVVVGFVEPHGRRLTEQMADGLEVVPRRTMAYRDAEFTEMDLDAVLARRPAVALVDELAHTNVPGCRNTKRWQDIDELLDAGIDVISTVNIQHLESLNDAVRSITGVVQRETVPDEVVRRADQIELVDMTPEALRRRLVHGNVYPLDRVDVALSNYFRPGNLTALRELALLWLADRVDEGLQRYRHEHGISAPWPARERVVVAVTGGSEGETLIRRAARIAGHGSGVDLVAVHVAPRGGPAESFPAALAHQRTLVESLGGTFHIVVDRDVPEALLGFARAVNATQLVLGSSRRRLWQRAFRPGVGATVARLAEGIDVHMVPHERAGQGRRLPEQRRAAFGRRHTAEAEQARRLAESRQIRGTMLAALAHDLRSPLAGVRESVSTLRRDDLALSAEERAEVLAAAEAAADRLNRLVDDLLDLSRLQTDTVAPVLADADLGEVVSAAVAEAPPGVVRLETPGPLPTVRTDPGLAQRVIANMVENAIGFSPAGVPVLVQVIAGQDRVEVRVVDRGPGVPDEFRERLFEPFERLGETPADGGAGLGLAVARGFARALGGTLVAGDTPGGGLTMVLSLPRAEPASASSSSGTDHQSDTGLRRSTR